MKILQKKCLCECGQKCWVLLAILTACSLFVGVLIGYVILVTSAEKIQYGYQIAEQVRNGEITDMAEAQEKMTGNRVRAGGFLSDTKDFLIQAGHACKEGVDWAFGATKNSDIKKSTLLMSGQ